MGLSFASTAAIIGVSFILILQIFTTSLPPIISDVTEAYDRMKDRTVEQCQTDMNITSIVDVGWWNTSWANRKLIIINHSMVQEDQKDFPVLIYRSADAELAAQAKSNGDDILFMSSDNSTQYNHEIENYDNTTGELTAWVKIPSLSSTQDTTLLMYYGNPSSSNQENITGTWNGNFRMVHHLNESSETLYDSTSYGNNGTNNGASYNASSKIDGGYDFDGSDSINCGDDPSLDITTAITLEAWVKDPPLIGSDKSSSNIRIVDKRDEKLYAHPSKTFSVKRTISGDENVDVIFVALFSPGVMIQDMIVKDKSVFSNVYTAGMPNSEQEHDIETIRDKLPRDVKQLGSLAYSKPFRVEDTTSIEMQFTAERLNNIFSDGRISYLVIASNGNYDVETTTHWDKPMVLIDWFNPFSIFESIIEFLIGNPIESSDSPALILILTKEKDYFAVDEEARFTFEYLSEEEVLRDVDISTKPPQIKRWESGNVIIETFVYDSRGEPVDVKPEIKEVREGEFDITLPKKRGFRGGLYTLKVELTRDNVTHVEEKEFIWGLVSLNTKKSIYRPGETAEFILVVLDKDGRSVCDAIIELSVTDSVNKTTYLSTSDGTITPDDECGIYNAYYGTEIEGNHRIDVSALIEDIRVNFSTYFLALQDYEFDIIRNAPSKIDPTRQEWFDVEINIESFVNASSLLIKEFVPAEFEISNANATIVIENSAKVLTWDKDLIENRTSVNYSYSVPHVWPYLYALGPAELHYDTQKFKEARPWFVAVDPDTKDAVDSNVTDMDGFADKGVESNFANAQDVSPDSDYMNIQEENTGSVAVDEWLENDGDATILSDATHHGSPIYLATVDTDNYLTIDKGKGSAQWYTFDDTVGGTGTYTVNISVYFIYGDGNDDLIWGVDTNGDDTPDYSGTILNPTSGWYTDSVGSLTQAEVNAVRARVEGVASAGYNDPDIDAIRLGAYKAGTTNYEIDFEYNWSDADYNEDNKEVCFYVGSHTGVENLNVSYWSGSWTSLGQMTSTGWTNLTATGLLDSTYEIEIIGDDESSDSSQDDWDIDCIFLHTWTPNNAPAITNPEPANESTEQSLTPVCNVTISDQDGGTVDVYFYENTTGSWKLQQINSSVDVSSPANVIWDNYSNASEYSTKYWWSVNVTDGYNWTNETYYFTTSSSIAPTISGEIPVNQSADINRQSICNVTVDDANGDTLTVYFYENTTGGWVLQQTNSSIDTGGGPQNVIWDNYSNASEYSTKYWWSVNVSDGPLWTNETYSFTTKANVAPTITGEVPANQSTEISTWPVCNVTVGDTNGDEMTVYFYENTTGVWKLQQTNASVANNSKVVWLSYNNASDYLKKYWWSVNVTDEHDWTNETYHFKTTDVNKVIVSKEKTAYALEISLDGSRLHGIVNNTNVTAPIDTSWHYVVLSYDGTTLALYVDGELQNTTTMDGSIPINEQDVLLGERLTGTLDELRISNSARSDSWVETSYNMMNSPTTFIRVESEQNQQYTYLSITIKNTGSATIKITEFSIMVNGTGKPIIDLQPYLYPRKEANILVDVLAAGIKRNKLITGNCISDCEEYG